MWKTILYFLLINFAFVILVVGIYAIGFEYDNAHQIYPETVRVSYDLSLAGRYGQRWVKFLKIMLIFGVLADIVAVSIYYTRNQKTPSLE